MFNEKTYKNDTRLAANAAKNGERKLNVWASASLAAIINNRLSPLAVAKVVYDELQPVTAKGKLAEPKQKDDDSVSVSSLRNADGGEIFRKAFDDMQYCIANREYAEEAVIAFATTGGKLRSLKAEIVKAKAEAAKAETESLPAAKAEQEPNAEAETAAPSFAEVVMEFATYLDGVEPSVLDDAGEIALTQVIEQIARITSPQVELAEAA